MAPEKKEHTGKRPVVAVRDPGYPRAVSGGVDRRGFMGALGVGAAYVMIFNTCCGAARPAMPPLPEDNTPKDEKKPPPPHADGDNDRDRIPDSEDDCPNDPEVYNGFEDEDGCPDQGKVTAGIPMQPSFHFGNKFGHKQTSVSGDTKKGLVAVAVTMLENPHIDLAVIIGHCAKNEGNPKKKRTLSEKRARKALDFLAKEGVSRSRMKTIGLSDFCPVDPGSNEQSHERNRRIELKVLSVDSEPTGATVLCERAIKEGITLDQ